NGNGVKQDSIHAVELFRKACDGGDTKGCFNLGWMYDEGNGVKQDSFEAVAFYRKGCDGGNAT
ncbi:MAG: sel1 repeat family protein, partial [Nitrospira sp.]|nr:sel1 repeat family protein [Nitrospira sp.]